MAVPDFQSLMLPFLETLQDGHESTVRDLAEQLAQRFKLTDEERQERMASGQQTVFSNRVAWAKTHLKNAGLINNQTRGKVSISDDGKQVLLRRPAIVNCRFLKQFPSYLKFIGQTSEESNEVIGEVVESGQTPQELLDSSFNTLRKATAEDLLAKLKVCSAGFFEQVVVRLLMAMGYGGVTGGVIGNGKTR